VTAEAVAGKVAVMYFDLREVELQTHGILRIAREEG
jgi:hypothetical protein